MHPIRDRAQGPATDTRWMFYAKWWLQYRKGAAGSLSRYCLLDPIREDKARRAFYGFDTMRTMVRTKRFTFFLRSNAYHARRPYAGKLRLAPARWI